MKTGVLHPVGLRTEYRVAPLGVDTPQPRLSWECAAQTSARGLWQAAYEILVATDAMRLRAGHADLWESGVVESSDSVHVAYAGAPLVARQCCFWAVRVRDQEGGWSDWSASASWTMGAIDPSHWTASWIGDGSSLGPWGDTQSRENTLTDVWCRRSVNFPQAPLRATAFVASVGFHELYVNGTRVGDAVLAPHVTDNSKRARYLAYEIASWLRPGDNTIALWLGTGWSIFPKFATNDKPRAPIACAQFEFDWSDGSTQRLISDASWRVHPASSALLGSWDFKKFGGELQRGDQEIPAWANPGFDDSGWKPAVVFHPKLQISADCAEPNVCATELRGQAVETIDGAQRIDFGRNFSGWVEIPLRGQPGDRVELLFSERGDRPLTHDMRSAFVIGPGGSGVFRHRFNYNVGRWVTVRGAQNELRPEEVRGWLVRPGYENAASFECSAPLLNQIFATTLWTFENLTLGGYVVDCPHRERMGYGGDAHATTATGLSAFRLGAFYTKWSEDWRDVQGRTPSWGIGIPPGEAGGGGHEEGNLPYTAPTYWGGGGPAWSGYCVHLPWEVYRRYGDEQILRNNFSTIERWLAFLETKAHGELLGRYGGSWDFLGDWFWPGAHGTNGDTRETLFFNNCYWIYNLQVASAIARIIGRRDLSVRWARRAAELRRTVHEEFFNPEDASYVNGFQAYLAMALLVDVPPAGLRAAVWRRLEHEILVVRGGHIHAGIIGGTFLFQLLMEARRDDLIHAMVYREDAPGWGAMLRHGATTFWEAWEENADSHLHSSFLFVGAWFTHGVLGIQPDPQIPGFKHFVIRPGLIGQPGLTWARGHFDSPYGRIAVAWRCKNDAIAIELHIPANTSATVHFPTASPESITDHGRTLDVVDGLENIRQENDQTVATLGSGDFAFMVRRDVINAGTP